MHTGPDVEGEKVAIPVAHRRVGQLYERAKLPSLRTTCTMPILSLSTAEARWYVGSRSDFDRTGSVGNGVWGSLRDPGTMSSEVVRAGTVSSYKTHEADAQNKK